MLMEVLVRVGTPVCVRGVGKAWGGSKRANKTGTVGVSLPWCSETLRGSQPTTEWQLCLGRHSHLLPRGKGGLQPP